MKYQVFYKGELNVEAKRINDPYLIQQANLFALHGMLDDVTLLVDGKEENIDLIFDKAQEKIDKYFSSRRKIMVIDGVSGLKRKPVWIKK